MILSAFLIDLKCRWLQSGLADLEKKTPNTCIFAYGRFFFYYYYYYYFCIFTRGHFFEIFENHQKYKLKCLNVFRFI